MSVTVENALTLPYRIVGNQKETVTNVTFDSSYLSEGETLTKAQCGLSSVERATATIKAVKGSVNVANVVFDPVNSVIHLYDETPGEVASEANVEGVVAQVICRGV